MDFESFGYETPYCCVVCAQTPARLEPRSNCAVCEKHYTLPYSVLQKHFNDDPWERRTWGVGSQEDDWSY